MIRKYLYVLALGLIAAAASDAQAGLYESVLTKDGELDVLQDNSVGTLFDDGSAPGVIDEGDVIAGFVRIQKSTTGGFDISPTMGELIVVFAAQVISTGDGDAFRNGIKFTLAPTTTAGTSLNDLLPSFGGVFSDNAVAAVLSAPASSSPVDPTTQRFDTDALGNLNSGIWTLDAIAGFDTSNGGLNRHGAADFFEAELRDFDGDGQISIAELLAQPVQALLGLEAAGLSILFGPDDMGYLPVDVQHLDGSSSQHDIGIPSTSLLRPSATEAGNNYAFADQASVLINPVPEPGSMTLLVLGALSACGAGIRRRRNNDAV